MHWEEGIFALPKLSEQKEWYRIASTKEGICKIEKILEDQQRQVLDERTITVFVGKR